MPRSAAEKALQFTKPYTFCFKEQQRTCYETRAPGAPFGAVQPRCPCGQQSSSSLSGARCCPQKLLERAGPWLGGCSGLQPNSQLWSWRCPSASRTLTGSVLWPLPWGWACSIAEPLSGRKHFPNSNLNRPRLSFVRFLWVLSRITAETSLRAPLLALTRKLQTVLRFPLSLL